MRDNIDEGRKMTLTAFSPRMFRYVVYETQFFHLIVSGPVVCTFR